MTRIYSLLLECMGIIFMPSGFTIYMMSGSNFDGEVITIIGVILYFIGRAESQKSFRKEFEKHRRNKK